MNDRPWFGPTLALPGFPAPVWEPGRREAIAESRKRPVKPSSFYLGPKSFAEACPMSPNLRVHESTPKWLVNYWPAKRCKLRAAILEEMTCER